MRRYIIADNQELTRFALESLLQNDEDKKVTKAFDKAGLVAQLKEDKNAVVLLDFRLYDFTDEEQLLIIAERFPESQWVLISDDLTPQFVRRVAYTSHQFSIVYKDGPMSEIREALQATQRNSRYLSQRALDTIISQQQEEEKPDLLTNTEIEGYHSPQEHLPQAEGEHGPRGHQICATCWTCRFIRILYIKNF